MSYDHQRQDREDPTDNENFQPAVRKHFTSINDIVNSVGTPNIGNRNRNIRDRRLLQPHYHYMRKMRLPYSNIFNPADAICTHFLLQCYNKTRKSAVYSGQWSPDGRRLVLGTKLGELTLWEGETFKFERIVQHKPWMVHPIDTVAWSRNANFLLAGDETGNIIYFDKGMTWVHNVQEMHTGPVRGLSFSPSETKFASCSDDGSVRIWDYRSGKPDVDFTDHLSDVKCCEWHPHRSLVASGSKDNAVKLFDPRCGKAITTIHSHKNSILCCGWNTSGNLLATGSRDNLVKVFDIRACKEFAVLRGHENQVTSLAWHPQQESLLLSGGYTGNLVYWVMGNEGPHSTITGAHNYSVNAILWHPLGHSVATAANDGICKFWSREPPGSTLEEELEEWQEPSMVVLERGPLPPPVVVQSKSHREGRGKHHDAEHGGGMGPRRYQKQQHSNYIPNYNSSRNNASHTGGAQMSSPGGAGGGSQSQNQSQNYNQSQSQSHYQPPPQQLQGHYQGHQQRQQQGFSPPPGLPSPPPRINFTNSNSSSNNNGNYNGNYNGHHNNGSTYSPRGEEANVRKKSRFS